MRRNARATAITATLFAVTAVVLTTRVAFPAGTGICHTFLNNTDQQVRLLVVGEKPKPENRIRYPLNTAHELTREDRWIDPPQRPLGPHDGKARVVKG